MPFREFIPGVCCPHDWQATDMGGQRCALCAATCKRDGSGAIIDYMSGNELAIRSVRMPETSWRPKSKGAAA